MNTHQPDRNSIAAHQSTRRAKFTAVSDAAWHAFAYTLAGWLLAIVLVAGLSGIFKRD